MLFVGMDHLHMKQASLVSRYQQHLVIVFYVILDNQFDRDVYFLKSSCIYDSYILLSCCYYQMLRGYCFLQKKLLGLYKAYNAIGKSNSLILQIKLVETSTITFLED